MLLQPILRSFLLIAVFVVALAPVHEAKADGGTIMAGILSEKGYDDFSFTGSNNEILFVDLNAAVYQTQGRKGGSHEEVAVVSDPLLAAAESSGGCSGEDGGPGGFCLQVLDTKGDAICWADRPMQPGWMRDPSLACPLPAEGSYILRIFLRSEGENVCAATDNYLSAEGRDIAKRLYTIDVTKRDLSIEGTLDLGGRDKP